MSLLIELNDMPNNRYYTYLDSLTKRELLKLREIASEEYYNSGECGLSDERYDAIDEILKTESKQIGAKCTDGVKLPHFMGSLNKIKAGQISELEKWISKNSCDSYVIENKIDGVSCLLIIEPDKNFLYTRGNGITGSDISHLFDHILNIPVIDLCITVRGELVMDKNVFKEKYSDRFANPRNMVTGIIGTKGRINENIEDIRFIAYEIIGKNIKPEEQLLKLKTLGFEVVQHEVRPELSDSILHTIIRKRREITNYEMDGLVIQPNKKYVRNTSGNPQYAFAYKTPSENAITTVNAVKWNVSKRGLIKPTISVEPVNIGGVTISYTTGFNAAYIVENKIGKGAIIEITRSGDVIPYIVRVVRRADKPEMPTIEYKWNDSHVDIVNTGDDTKQKIKLLTSFFSAMEIKHVGQKTIEKLVEEGIDTLEKIINTTIDDLLKIDGFQLKGAERIYINIQDGIKGASASKILSSSGIFGFGFAEKKISALFSSIPDILEMDSDDMYEKILGVEGFSEISAKKIIKNLDNAKKLLKLINPVEIQEEIKFTSNDLESMRVVFSGFRDKKLSESIEKRGGKVMTSVSSKTTDLIVKYKDSSSDKILTAQKNGTIIHTIEEFIDKHGF